MADVPSFVVTVDWAASMATVAIHGELDSSTCDLITDRLCWVMESHPQRLVLDLAGVGDRFSPEALGVISEAREQLPPESVLSVRSPSITVRRHLERARWNGVRLSDAAEDLALVRAGPHSPAR